ncbi:C40 family peptidase [Metabacillus sp. GX 13764]|uniref:C40 family peptidase n=1 Tax=Metabacillus kandeliae TaxID=2900151 RepID=UPI001E55D6C4|nr:C40 family peptidase [Metabacillus kandeliae]MCD7034261.1 C40 family peptidase [Metabacillus kandeliae]
MLANQIILTGLKYLGTPYVFNAKPHQTKTFDCSSFMQYIYGVHGISLPRSSRQQYSVGTPISFEEIRKGDLLFFTTKTRKDRQLPSKIGHVGVYLGRGHMLHTYKEGKKVMVSEINAYWKSAFVGGKRVI